MQKYALFMAPAYIFSCINDCQMAFNINTIFGNCSTVDNLSSLWLARLLLGNSSRCRWFEHFPHRTVQCSLILSASGATTLTSPKLTVTKPSKSATLPVSICMRPCLIGQFVFGCWACEISSASRGASAQWGRKCHKSRPEGTAG